jgi:hypothetical protein
MQVLAPEHVGDQLDTAVLHATHPEDTIRDRLQPIRLAADDHHLHAQIVAEVDMQRSPHRLAQVMLQLSESVAEIANVVVVDQRQRRHGIHAKRNLRTPDLGARQIAEQLGACAVALRRQGVDFLQKVAVDGDTEADEVGFHRPHDIAPLTPPPPGLTSAKEGARSLGVANPRQNSCPMTSRKGKIRPRPVREVGALLE